MHASLKTLAFAAVALLSACAGPAKMTAGPTVLGAEGEVKVAEGPNGNTQVRIVIQHLADPSAVTPGGTVYIAWIQPAEGGLPQNMGQIQLDQNKEGKLETITPYKAFTVTVTAERLATASAPSSNPVLTTRIAAK